MTIEETTQYQRTKKRLIKKHILSENEIEETLAKLQENPQEPSLHYKKMTCKKDKNRYSIRVLNTQYRILMSVIDKHAILVCVCDHDEYDVRNKNC
jgi:plasmid maintenance system killer protein